MQNSSELVLFYSPLALADASALKAVLAQMGIHIHPIGPSETGRTVGYLAGLKGFPALDGPSPAIADPMLVLCGFTSDRLDLLLKNLRAAGVPPIPYKAVLTEHNCTWTLAALYEELKGERAAIAAKQKEPKQ